MALENLASGSSTHLSNHEIRTLNNVKLIHEDIRFVQVFTHRVTELKKTYQWTRIARIDANTVAGSSTISSPLHRCTAAPVHEIEDLLGIQVREDKGPWLKTDHCPNTATRIADSTETILVKAQPADEHPVHFADQLPDHIHSGHHRGP